jgi:DNA adenine methylase
MSGVVSRWLGGVEQLDFIAERLLRVQIENRPAIDVIKLYDNKETLFYCDPPYIHETRGDTKSYGFEMTDYNHVELADTLNSIEGLVAISNYECNLMDELYPSGKWTKIYSPEKIIHSTKEVRTEVLWVNYNLNELQSKSNITIFSNE